MLRDSLRSDDLICRYGGDEFAIAFPACAGADASKALDALRDRLDAAITVASIPKYTVSFGVTDAEEHETLTTTIARADGALLGAKLQGRDRVVRYDHTGNTVRRPPAGPVDRGASPTPPAMTEIRRQMR